MIGDYLKSLRETRKMSLGDVEKNYNVSGSFLSQVERNKKFPGPATLRKLSKAYLVPYEVLLQKANMLEDTELSVEDKKKVEAIIRNIDAQMEELKKFLLK